MIKIFEFGSPAVKFKENDLVEYRNILRNRRRIYSQLKKESLLNNVNSGGNETQEESNLQWPDGFLYNDIILFNDKIWNN